MILNGKLYLTWGKGKDGVLFRHPETTIKKADENWTKLNKQN